ncbi:MAG TPA: hypothetical protein VF753_00205 [Terriglobales bacterium]
MGKSKITGVSVAVVFFALIMAVNLSAQTSTHTTMPGQTGGTHPAQARAESNPACQKILAECKNLGFVDGQWKKDNGLWKDCFDPVVKGTGQPTRDGKPIRVPVSESEIQQCRTSVGSGHGNGTGTATGNAMHKPVQ